MYYNTMFTPINGIDVNNDNSIKVRTDVPTGTQEALNSNIIFRGALLIDNIIYKPATSNSDGYIYKKNTNIQLCRLGLEHVVYRSNSNLWLVYNKLKRCIKYIHTVKGWVKEKCNVVFIHYFDDRALVVCNKGGMWSLVSLNVGEGNVLLINSADADAIKRTNTEDVAYVISDKLAYGENKHRLIHCIANSKETSSSFKFTRTNIFENEVLGKRVLTCKILVSDIIEFSVFNGKEVVIKEKGYLKYAEYLPTDNGIASKYFRLTVNIVLDVLSLKTYNLPKMRDNYQLMQVCNNIEVKSQSGKLMYVIDGTSGKLINNKKAVR